MTSGQKYKSGLFLHPEADIGTKKQGFNTGHSKTTHLIWYKKYYTDVSST